VACSIFSALTGDTLFPFKQRLMTGGAIPFFIAHGVGFILFSLKNFLSLFIVKENITYGI